MSDTPQGPGWWLASDGKYYAPEQRTTPPPPPPPPPTSPSNQPHEPGLHSPGWQAPSAQEPSPAPTAQRRRPKALFAVVGIAVVAAVSTTVFVATRLLAGGEPTVPGPDALGVSFTLMTLDSDISGELGDCSGTGGYDDFGPGMDIRILNQDNKLIGSGSTKSLDQLAVTDPEYFELLKGDDFDPNDDAEIVCQVAALVPVSGGAEFYRVEIGRRGEMSYTRADLEEADWQLDLSLGP